MKKVLKTADVKNNIEVKLARNFGCSIKEASKEQLFH